MSVEAMAIALHHSRATGTVKLVLIGIANHDGDGGAWPSIATLAKYAALNGKPANNAKVVRRAIATLVELGEITVDRQAGGPAAMPDYERPNLYHITLTCPPECDGSKKHRLRTDPRAAQPPGQPARTPRAEQPPPPGPASPPGGGRTAPRPRAEQPPKPSFEPAFEPSMNHPGEPPGSPPAGTAPPAVLPEIPPEDRPPRSAQPQPRQAAPPGLPEIPPPTCPRHAGGNPGDEPCRACRDARTSHDRARATRGDILAKRDHDALTAQMRDAQRTAYRPGKGFLRARMTKPGRENPAGGRSDQEVLT